MAVNRGKPTPQPPRQPIAGSQAESQAAGRSPVPNRPPLRPAVQPVPGRSSDPMPPAVATEYGTLPPDVANSPVPRRVRRQRQRGVARFRQWLKRLLWRWQIALLAAFMACMGAAGLAIAFIVQLPALPNCPAIFWPLASAAMRFECARIAASKQTANDLLEAIALVDGLSPTHEMRPEADRMIELWSQEVLKLADELFHAGKLDQAIAAAQKIPHQVTAYRLVEKRIQTWETVWKEAEAIYQKSEAAIRKRDWRTAFDHAVGLLDINNKYWQTTRYDDLNNRINTARTDGNKLFRAERLADAGDFESLKQAIKLAEEIRPDSYIHALAQVKIQEFGRDMLDLAQRALDRRNLQEALSIINEIPSSAKIEWEKRDLTVLANAQSYTWQDTVAGLETAISQAQRIQAGRPLYSKAQNLIARWQYEIEGVAQLERARMLAQEGSTEAFLAAIAAASQINRANPRWDEAQTTIRQWNAQVQTIADRPILEQADQLATGGDLSSLQAAINQASQIGSGRALYGEAQQRVRQWTRQIQTAQDQPYLDQARAYARSGDLQGAIQIAQQISSGRALYGEAQADIRQWRGQIDAQIAEAQAVQTQAQAQRNLQAARQLASSGDPAALASAIRMASQVTTTGDVQAEITASVNDWSWQLLQRARDQANILDFAGAIATAQKIPAQTAAYAEAQTQIQTWQSGRP